MDFIAFLAMDFFIILDFIAFIDFIIILAILKGVLSVLDTKYLDAN